MGRVSIVTFFVCSMGIMYSQTGQAELWRCAQNDSAAVFTDRPNASRGCEPYNVPVAPSESNITKAAPSVPPEGYFSTPEHGYNLKDFATLRRNEPESFRGITPGMTESQVLKLAGYPDKRYRLPCDSQDGGSAFCLKRWVYNYSDGWLVELTLDTGRVTEINKFRRQ